MKKYIVCLLLGLTISKAWSQNIVTLSANAMRANDKVEHQIMEFCDPGNFGDNESWDFSFLSKLNKSYNVQYSIDSLNRIHQYSDQNKKSFVIIGDTLDQYKLENRLTKIIYYKKKFAMKYPLAYGDSISSNFEGYGLYCDKHFIKVKGQVLINADGEGTLILSDRDTLNNVLRVCTITTTSMAMNVDNVEIDSTKLQQEIEEKYEWYCKGFRYPMYSIVQKTSFVNLERIGSTQRAYRLLPEDLENLEDAVNDSIQEDDHSNVMQAPQAVPDIFHYNVKTNNGRIDIKYTVDADASVKTIISNIQGMIYRHQNYTVKGGETGNIYISTSGLIRGLYELYINVNGKIYTETINIRN